MSGTNGRYWEYQVTSLFEKNVGLAQMKAVKNNLIGLHCKFDGCRTLSFGHSQHKIRSNQIGISSRLN